MDWCDQWVNNFVEAVYVMWSLWWRVKLVTYITKQMITIAKSTMLINLTVKRNDLSIWSHKQNDNITSDHIKQFPLFNNELACFKNKWCSRIFATRLCSACSVNMSFTEGKVQLQQRWIFFLCVFSALDS
jgi:hypothetical protein